MLLKSTVATFLFILSTILIGQNLDKPFWGEHDWNGARYGNIARNYLRYGLIETKLGQVENSGTVTKLEFEYYTHYPPLLPIVVSISYLIFGISESSTRLIPLLSTAGSTVLIFIIGFKLWNFKTGIVASLLALGTPMVLYFGKNPSHDPLALFFILFALYWYLLSVENKRLLYKVVFTASVIFAEITAWAGYFLIPALTVGTIIRKDRKAFKYLIPYWFLSLGIFLFYLGHVYFLTGNISGGDLFESLGQRSGISRVVQPQELNVLNYLNILRLWFSTLFTITLITLSIIWLIGKKFTGIQKNDWVVFSLGIIGIIYLLVFSNAAFIHSYLIIYFLPTLVLSGALGIETLVRLIKLQKFYFLIVALFILFVIFERKNYLLALNYSSMDKFAVDIGKAINQQAEKDDTILISPFKFSYSADKFLRFYSDRRLVYSDNLYIPHDIRVLVDQDNGNFEIIKR